MLAGDAPLRGGRLSISVHSDQIGEHGREPAIAPRTVRTRLSWVPGSFPGPALERPADIKRKGQTTIEVLSMAEGARAKGRSSIC